MHFLREQDDIYALETGFANGKVKNISPTTLMVEMAGSY